MSHSSSEARSDGDDDAEPGQSRVTRAKRPCPSASDVVALPVAVPVARVIRAAAAASRSMSARRGGYSPSVAVGMAGAHIWAPYSAIVPALRSLLLTNLKKDTSAAREAIAGLYDHATPFSSSRRFPAGEVYVCLDRVPLAQTMQRIVQPLVTAEAAGMFGEQLVDACSNYISGISSALLDLTRVDDRPGISPILYDRAIFESVFLLTWTEP